MTSAYAPRNAPQRQRTITFNLKLSIDKSLAGSDKVRLPENVLNSIMREYPRNPPNPVIFEIQSILVIKGKPQLHCGVLEFTAPEETALIPFWMTNCLVDSKSNRVKNGTKMRFILKRSLESLKFAKFKPMDKRFARDLQTPKATLEHALRKFTVLTEGQRLPIIYNGKVYPLFVEKLNPSPAGHLINTNLQVEFSAPDANNINNESKSSGDSKSMETDNDNENDYDDFEDTEKLALYTPISHTFNINKNKKNKGIYYKVKIANPNYPFRCVLTLNKGDANIYVHNKYDKPSITQCIWCNEDESNKKEIYILSNDKNYSKWFYIGIHPFMSDSIQFEFFVDQEKNKEKENDANETLNVASGNQLGSAVDLMDEGKVQANTQKCDNCGQMISNAAFMMHSIQCSRINWKCPICSKIINKSMKDKHIHCTHNNCNGIFENEKSMKRHILLKHTKIECDLCNELFYPNEMIGHQKHECLMRMVPCKWCGMQLQYLQLKEHESYCGSLTIECELCGKTVHRKWLENHLASEHDLNPTLDTKRVNQILNSNLGLNQTVNWEEREIKNDDTNNKTDENGLDKPNETNLSDPDDKDEFVRDIKRQFSQFHSFEEEQAAQEHEEELEQEQEQEQEPEETEDQQKIKDSELTLDDNLTEELHDFLCPYCQKHPPKSIDFGDHLEQCCEQAMHDDD